MEINKISSRELVNKVRKAVKMKEKWHFHFLTLDCIFNLKKKFAIVFENEKIKENCICYFDKKPEKELKLCENLFYNRPEDFNKY